MWSCLKKRRNSLSADASAVSTFRKLVSHPAVQLHLSCSMAGRGYITSKTLSISFSRLIMSKSEYFRALYQFIGRATGFIVVELTLVYNCERTHAGSLYGVQSYNSGHSIRILGILLLLLDTTIIVF